jgi:glycosyltransferase involved in cell wall biosynthesis
MSGASGAADRPGAAGVSVSGASGAPGAPGLVEAAAVEWHGAPEDSATAFAPGSVHVVPLRFGSGVRMKILEAWARGIPVVSTPEGAAGLAARDGQELLVARDAPTFTAALARLRTDPALRAALTAAGRSALRQRHDPAATTRSLIALYAEVLAER